MISIFGTTNIYGTVNFGSGSVWSPTPPEESTLLTDIVSYYTMDDTTDSLSTYALTVNTGTLGNVGGKIGDTYSNSATTGTGLKCTTTAAMNECFGVNQPWSFNMWVKQNGSHESIILSKFDSGGVGGIYIILATNGSLQYDFRGTISNRLAGTYNSMVTDTNWTMITWTYNGNGAQSGIELYRNSVLQTLDSDLSDNLGSLTTSTVGPLEIGAAAWAGTQYQFEGDMDEVGFWDKSLTQSEVTELYNVGVGNQYPF